MPLRVKAPQLPWLRRLPLPVLSILTGLICGLLVWFLLDQFQTRALREIFQEELQERLDQRARESLIRFDQYVAGYTSVTKVLANHRRLAEYLEPVTWDEVGDVDLQVYHVQEPDWLPAEPQWGALIPAEYIFLFDSQGRPRETYLVRETPVLPELLESADIYIGQSRLQPLLTTLAGLPYLIVSHPMDDSFGSAMGDLMLVMPINAGFLAATQEGMSLSGAIIAMLDIDEQLILASSDNARLPAHTRLDQWADDYVVTAQSFFEHEGSDLNMQFGTLVSKDEMDATNLRVLRLERQHRIFDALVYIAVFTFLIYLVSLRLNKLLRRISQLSQRALGIKQPFPEGGNQLLVLEDWMRQFIRLVRSAGEEMRLRHEVEIRDTEAVKKAIFETSPDTIITLDEHGRVLDCNPQAELLLGYTHEQAFQQDLAELILVDADKSVFKKILKAVVSPSEELEGSAHRELTAIRLDGVSFPIEISVMRTVLERRLTFMVYIHDISRRKNYEQEVHRLAKFASESPSPVLRVNRRGVIIYANDASRPLLDYWGCSHGQTLPLYWRKQVALVMEKGWDAELELSSYGQIISLLLSPVVELDYVNIYGRDVTEVRMAEQQSRQHQAELVHVCRLSTMGEMATGLAHELNQPLSAIVNYANGCTRRIQHGIGGDEDILQALGHIASQADRAGQIIRRLRSLVGKQAPDRSILDINELVEEVVTFVEHDTVEMDLEIELDLDEAGLRVRVDLVQIEQVLLNLVRNAMDALRDVPEKQRHLIIRTSVETQDSVRIEVHDSGLGIDEETQAKLFDSFFTTKTTGMGMGLPISKTIINDHGGKIWAESNTRTGTSFFVVLPTALELAKSICRIG